MHEASIAQSVIDIALRELEKSGFKKVDSVTLRIGSASGLLIDSLEFTFHALKAGTPLEGARLLIEEIPVGGSCLSCGRGFSSSEKFVLCCPHCESREIKVHAGRALDITEIEVS
jgi:hydrogenase nickel incorporation protein HypA/HybF